MAKENIEEVVDEEIIYEEEVVEDGDSGSSSGGGESFFDQNRNIILAVVGVIALLLVGGVVYNNSQSSKNTEAQAAMVQAISFFEADSLMLAMNGSGAQYGFIDIVDNYGSTESGNLAKMYLGICYLRNKQYQEAIDVLESRSPTEDMASASSYYALGVAYEELNQYEDAAKAYEKAARTPSENDQTTPLYLMDAARAWETIDENDKAIEIYRSIKKKYPLSSEGLVVDKYIARLGGEI